MAYFLAICNTRFMILLWCRSSFSIFFSFFNVLLNLSLLSHYFALFYYIFGNYLWMSIFVWNIQPITQHKFNAHKCINIFLHMWYAIYIYYLYSLYLHIIHNIIINRCVVYALNAKCQLLWIRFDVNTKFSFLSNILLAKILVFALCCLDEDETIISVFAFTISAYRNGFHGCYIYTYKINCISKSQIYNRHW